MKLFKPRYIVIISVAVVVTAILVIHNGFENTSNSTFVEAPVVSMDPGNTQVEHRQPAVCDLVADTFYLNFHSNMDSAAFYNELKSNPVTRDGIDIGYQKLKVDPTFNEKGCLDYVILFNSSSELAEAVDYSVELEKSLKDGSVDFNGVAPVKREIKESKAAGNDKINIELKKLYGNPKVYEAGGVYEYLYKDNKVRRQLRTKPSKGDAKVLVITSWRLCYYSDRYIEQQELIEQQNLLQIKERNAQRDSLNATLGSRL